MIPTTGIQFGVQLDHRIRPHMAAGNLIFSSNVVNRSQDSMTIVAGGRDMVN